MNCELHLHITFKLFLIIIIIIIEKGYIEGNIKHVYCTLQREQWKQTNITQISNVQQSPHWNTINKTDIGCK